jgi:hypothetical protein
MQCTNGDVFESVYGKEMYFQCYSFKNEKYRQTLDRMYVALDNYFKTNPHRRYVKSEGGRVSYVKFLQDVQMDPITLINVCPMLMINRNQIYWRDKDKMPSDIDIEIMMWCAYDLGFRWTTEAYGIGGTYCYRLVDYDMGRIEKTFLCPISDKLLVDAVVTPNGVTYDRATIKEYIRLYGHDPVTNEPLVVTDLVPNKALMTISTMTYLGIKTLVEEEE